jgi:hypothetical protein
LYRVGVIIACVFACQPHAYVLFDNIQRGGVRPRKISDGIDDSVL